MARLLEAKTIERDVRNYWPWQTRWETRKNCPWCHDGGLVFTGGGGRVMSELAEPTDKARAVLGTCWWQQLSRSPATCPAPSAHSVSAKWRAAETFLHDTKGCSPLPGQHVVCMGDAWVIAEKIIIPSHCSNSPFRSPRPAGFLCVLSIPHIILLSPLLAFCILLHW